MTEKQKTIIEINGIKLEVDLRTAKRIDQLSIGSRVKCLVKGYGNEFSTCAGVIVGFEPFPTKPSVIVAYLTTDYSTASLVFKTFNADTKDFEVVADLDNNALEVDRATVLQKFDREIAKMQIELEEVQARKDFFIKHFGRYFADTPVTA